MNKKSPLYDFDMGINRIKAFRKGIKPLRLQLIDNIDIDDIDTAELRCLSMNY